MKFELTGKRVFVAGHQGMVGSAIVRRLSSIDCELVTADRSVDLRNQDAVKTWFAENQPEVVVLAAAKVGGILANDQRPGEFLYDNLAIELNVIEAARTYGVQKLLFLGSSCIYPREATQPICEEALLCGPLESTNEWYAIAKIAGVKLCQAYRRQYGCDFISAMPTNLYGPGDNFDLQTSHVLPALLRKAHQAATSNQTFVVWGSGTPMREFLHVDDLADACVFLLENYTGEAPINVGSGEEVSISELAETIATTVGLTGKVEFDPTKPDGTPRKLLDTTKLSQLGWQSSIDLGVGLRATFDWYLRNVASGGLSADKAAISK